MRTGLPGIGIVLLTLFGGSSSVALSGPATGEVPGATAGSGPGGTATGPVGAFRFTQFVGNKVGRITTVGDAPVLTISKSAPASVVSGQNLTYTLTYGNTGPGDATGVVISDSLPAGTSFVSVTGGGALSLGSVIWSIGDLNAGVTAQTVSFTVAVTATSGTISNNSSAIQASGVSPVSGPPVTTTVIPLGPPTSLGNSVQSPNASDAFLFPTPYTDVDLVSPAPFAGSLTTATFAWSIPGCVSALKIKFFRPSGENLVFLTERGPFDSSPTTVTLFPDVPIQPGDLIGVSHLTNCGNPVGAFPGAAAGYIAFGGDVASTVARSGGTAVKNFTLAVQASGVATERTQGIVPVVVSIPGVPPSFYRTGFQMHNPTALAFAGRLVFHPQGTVGSGADSSLTFSLEAGQTQVFDDLLPAMGLNGPRIGSLDIVMPTGASAPVVAARIFNDGGAAGTTGFTVGAASSDSILAAGDLGVLFTPADTGRFRLNIGVRSGPSGAAMTVTRRNAAGTVVQTLTKSYPPTFFEQISGVEFLEGTAFGANDSITIQVISGSAIVYGATADNTTADPSIQFATKVQ